MEDNKRYLSAIWRTIRDMRDLKASLGTSRYMSRIEKRFKGIPRDV